jgi:hypothetical protein
MTDLEGVLSIIEDMQYDLDRKVEWTLTETLPFEEVRTKVVAVQVALNNLYVYVMSKQEEPTI